MSKPLKHKFLFILGGFVTLIGIRDNLYIIAVLGIILMIVELLNLYNYDMDDFKRNLSKIEKVLNVISNILIATLLIIPLGTIIMRLL